MTVAAPPQGGREKPGEAGGQEIDIAFGADDPYAPHVAAVIAAIVRRAPRSRFRFIVLHDGISAARRACVEATAPGARFCWIEVRDEDLPAFMKREHFSRAILFRLGLERLAPPDCKRVLYLDSDIAVMADIGELWRTDLAGAPLGAVVDAYVEADAFAERWNLPAPRVGYFNSGVLLIDMEQVRARNLFSKAIDFVERNGGRIRFSDQDALNFVVWNEWRPLPPAWNAQLNMVIPWIAPKLPPALQFHRHLPAILHYTGPEKPWTPNAYHPWKWLYWSNAARTPFAREVAKAAGMGPKEKVLAWLRWLRWRPPVDYRNKAGL